MTDLRTAALRALASLKGYRRELGCQQPCDAERALEAALEQPCKSGGASMTTLREAAQQALEALEICAVRQEHQWHGLQQVQIVKAALRAALEQPEQEPVAMCRTWHKGSDQHAELLDWTDALEALPDGEHHLYTHPPRREWRGLSKDESLKMWGMRSDGPSNLEIIGFARAIEAALKERNA